MKKILIILLTIATLLTLSACNQSSVDNSNIVTAATQIAYNGEEIAVSSIILKCDDKFYGIEVNEGVNFCNKNNYFTTSSGLTIILTNEDLEPGINTEDGYTSIQKLEDGLFLVVKGSDEKKVNDVFNHIFKANGEMYQMFKHDINSDWTKEVVITNDVISFSNGEDTTYIYQNPGSLSKGCYKGRIEPTVFYKQLRGIDIPITYPEDMGEDSVRGTIEEFEGYTADGIPNGEIFTNTTNLYMPYGKEYKNLLIDGYAIYSAYDISNIVGNNQQRKVLDNVYNYIILSKCNELILDLFKSYNEINKYYLNIEVSKDTTKPFNVTREHYNNNEMKNIATNIINSDGYRYHFGIVSSEDGDQTPENYYLDVPEYVIKEKKINTILSGMNGKLVLPTMMSTEPFYGGTKYGSVNNKYFAADARDHKSILSIENHGAYAFISDYINGKIGSTSSNNYEHGNHEYIMEGDYIYRFNADFSLMIYKNFATRNYYPTINENGMTEYGMSVEDDQFVFNDRFTLNRYEQISISPDLLTSSCSYIGENTLDQLYVIVSQIQY